MKANAKRRSIRFLTAVCAIFLLLIALAVTASAEETEYYYIHSVNGNDAAEGTGADAPLKSFIRASLKARTTTADKVVFVLMDESKITGTMTELSHTVPYIITTIVGKVDYGAKGAKIVFDRACRYVLGGDTTFENVTIEYISTLNCVARYNPITFGKGVTFNRLDGDTSGVYVVGGWQSPTDDFDATMDTHITIESGDFYAVIGGSRQKGTTDAKGLICTGTHYITVNGGEIGTLYGGSTSAHESQNVVLTVNGGKINTLNVGGDDARKINGTAQVTLAGGNIGTANINNVVGNATVELRGATVASMSVSYYNSTIKSQQQKAKSVTTLRYDGQYYTEDAIKAYEGFAVVENASVVYTKDGATGDGTSSASPASFADAIQKASQTGATVIVLGELKISDFAEPAHTVEITVKGDADASIKLSGTYALGGSTVFTGITLSGNGVLDARNGSLTVAADAETAFGSGLRILGSASLYAGSFKEISEASQILVSGAEVDNIVGGTKSTMAEIVSGAVGTLKTTNGEIEAFSLSISGGSLKKLVIHNVTKQLTLNLSGGKIDAYSATGENVKGTLLLDETNYSVKHLGEVAELFTVSDEKVFFIADGGTGNGASANAASASLAAAYDGLKESGGTIVIVGKYTLASNFNGSTNAKKITITSLYNGVDYAKTGGAELVLGATFYCGGTTEFSNITIRNSGSRRLIIGYGYDLTIGQNVTTIKDSDTDTYPAITGGASTAKNLDYHLTIESGTWGRVRAGAHNNGVENCNVTLTVNGGEFVEIFTLGSANSHAGSIKATINGGTFYQGIYAATLSTAEHYFKTDVSLTINGGTFYGEIGAARKTVSEYVGSYGGSFNVKLNGGDFAHLTALIGTEGIADMTSSLQVAESVDLEKEVTGTMSFTNPIRSNGADPWLFYHDGYYYYTATTGSSLGLARATNIGDLQYAEYVTVYKPEAGQAWSQNIWSPEIHYYSDEEIGEGNGGWYCYIACDDGDNVNHRMYVIKCLDGDNLLGRWGNPLTGEVNVPQKIEAKDIPGFADTWAAGQTDIRINGKLYMMYVTEKGRGTEDFGQTINIVEMTNPWTIIGESSVICYSEYDWEMGGYSYKASGKSYPKVVEGGTAVYADDGSIYIVYSGSGYWTVEYKLGQLKYLGGNPLDIKNWEKLPTPIFSKSDNINGCGHASYLTDANGQDWICYHAYIGKDTSSGRYAFVEPYFADKNGVVIADGTKQPADINTVYTVDLNPMPLGDKISGFDSVREGDSRFAKMRTYTDAFTDVTDSHWFYSFVKNAYEFKLANGTSNTKFSPDSSFTVAQALTAAANIHTIYNEKVVRALLPGEKWYAPYVDYCIENGIITKDQFANYDANITRGDMAIVFANILPASEYTAVRSGNIPDVTADMACASAVQKLYNAGIVGGDTGTGNYRPGDTLKRSEACVIFTRIAMEKERAK